MNFTFDYFNQQEKLYTVLCNPNKSELHSLGLMYDTKVCLRYNSLSDITFTYPQYAMEYSGNVLQPAYDLLKAKRVVLVESVGYFIIDDVTENTDGLIPTKAVRASSLEAELGYKKLNGFTGTLKFYDLITPTGTFMEKILKDTGWTVGSIDVDLLNTYRTFDISDGTVYSILMNDASTTYNCIFLFDTFAKTVSAVKTDNAVTQTDIYFSYNNLIQKASISEKSDEIVTALAVYGGGDLTIRSVNPLGTNYIYDFSYFKTTDWMSQDLIDAITAWENLISANLATYNGYLTTLRTQNADLITYQSDLATLQGDMDALLETKKVLVQTNGNLTTVNADIDAKQAEMDAKNLQISNKNADIAITTGNIVAINTLVSFSSNFTPTELEELRPYTIENTYQNSNIIITDIMTAVEIQDQAQELYNFAKVVLDKISEPRYEFSMDVSNFLALKQYQSFISLAQLGSSATIAIREDYVVENVLLELEFSLDNPEDCKMTFSNRLRLDGEDYKFTDLFGQTVKATSQVKFNQSAWGNWQDEYKNEVTDFITSALNTTTNNLINSSNQEITIDGTGLHGKTLVSPGVYSPKQLWLTSSALAFSDDSFDTSRLAIGNITYNSQSLYGLVADVIVGRILAGSQLSITNTTNNFLLDDNGAVLTNASFTIQNDVTKVLIDPSVGFKIQKNIGGVSGGDTIVPLTSVTAVTNPASSKTWSHTVSSSANRILILTASHNNSNSITSATYGSQSFTQLAYKTKLDGNKPTSEIWYIIAPTPGSATVTVNLNTSSFSEFGTTEYYNVNQSSPFGTYATATGTSSTPSVTVISATGELVIDSLSYLSGTSVVNAGQTQLYNVTSDGSWKGASSYKNGASSVNMGWTGAGADWAIIGVSITPSGSVPIWEDKMYLDIDGNAFFNGAINAESGTFTGELIAATGSFSGEISASSGNIGNWSITSTGLINSAAACYLQVNSDLSSSHSLGNLATTRNADGTAAWMDFTGGEAYINIFDNGNYSSILGFLQMTSDTAYLNNNTEVIVSKNTNQSYLWMLNDDLILHGGLSSGALKLETLDLKINGNSGYTGDVNYIGHGAGGSTVRVMHFMNGILTGWNPV